SLRQGKRRLQRPCCFLVANRPSLWAARRCSRRLRGSTSQRLPARRQAARPAPVPARSALAYVPAMAASQASARSERHTQTRHRQQRVKASSQPIIPSEILLRQIRRSLYKQRLPIDAYTTAHHKTTFDRNYV